MAGAKWKSPEARARSIAALRKHQYRDGGEFWRGKIVLPAHGHKLTRRLFELMNEDMTTIHEVARRSGVARTTLYKWRERPREPDLGLLEACLNVLGYELRIGRLGEKKRGRKSSRLSISPSENQ